MVTHFNPDAYEVCWIHGMASYFLIDQSMLNRTKNEDSDFVFLNLLKFNDNTVSMKMKCVLQQNLPKYLPNETVKNTHL